MADNCGDASTDMLRGAGSRWGRCVPKMVLLAGLVVYSLAIVSIVDESFPSNVDAVRFLILSHSILSGEGYTDIHRPLSLPHTRFPPVLPCMFAAVQWIAPGSLVPMKLAVASFGLLSIIAFYLFFRRLVGDLLAALLAVTIGIQLEMLRFSQQLMSDVPYIFFSILALFLIVRRVQSRQAGVWLEIAIGVALSLATLTRTIGLSLFAAFLVSVLLDRGFKKKVRCLSVVSLILLSSQGAWEVRNYVALGRFLPIYGDQLVRNYFRNGREGLVGPVDLLRGSIHNIGVHSRHLVQMTLPCLSFLPLFLPFFALIAAFGWVARLVRRRDVIEFYVLFYALILLPWPWAFDRFLLPIAGLLIFYFVQGFGLAVQRIWTGVRSAFVQLAAKTTGSAERHWTDGPLNVASTSLVSVILLVSLFVPAVLVSSERARDRFDRPPPDLGEFIVAASWIREHTPQDAVILTERSESSFIISGRKSFRPSDYQAEAMFRDAVAKDHLFVIESTKPQYNTASKPIARTLERTRGYWHVVFRTGSTYVIAQNGADAMQGQL